MTGEWRREGVAELRALLGGKYAEIGDVDLEEAYEGFSSDVYAARWMDPTERTVAAFCVWMEPGMGLR